MVAPYSDYINSLPKEEVKKALDEVRNPVEIAIWGCKNTFNFGAIIRTGHSFLVSGFWAIDIPWYYEKAAMTSMRWERDRIKERTTSQFLEETQGRNIVAFEKRCDLNCEDIRTFEYPENPILLLGSENDGIPDVLLGRAGKIVTIPILGLCNDLNIACAAGIICYDWYNKHTRK